MIDETEYLLGMQSTVKFFSQTMDIMDELEEEYKKQDALLSEHEHCYQKYLESKRSNEHLDVNLFYSRKDLLDEERMTGDKAAALRVIISLGEFVLLFDKLKKAKINTKEIESETYKIYRATATAKE